MSSAFVDTYNMVAILTKSDASEGFDQILDFLNGSYIKYALIVNPYIYVSCIKQFWNTVTVKQSADVTRVGDCGCGRGDCTWDVDGIACVDGGEVCGTGDGMEVKKLERANKVKTLKLRRLRKVGTPQRIKSLDDTIIEDVINQGRMIDELDKDEGVALMGEKEEEKKVKEVKVIAGDAQVEEVVAAASAPVSATSTIILAAEPNIPAAAITTAPVKVAAASTRRRKRVVIRDPEEESSAKTSDETKSKDKGKGIM
nr:hypothetical protein [Tanacetum cinerariifolium]